MSISSAQSFSLSTSRARLTSDFALPDDLTITLHDAHSRLLERDVETYYLPH